MDDHHFPYFSIHIAYYCHISAIQWLGGIGYLFSIFSIHIAYYCHISAIQWLGGIRYLFSLKKSPAQWFNWGKKAGTSRVFLGAWYILWYTICHYVSDLGGWSSILSNPFIRIYTALKKRIPMTGWPSKHQSHGKSLCDLTMAHTHIYSIYIK